MREFVIFITKVYKDIVIFITKVRGEGGAESTFVSKPFNVREPYLQYGHTRFGD